jgi:hypothetical protein
VDVHAPPHGQDRGAAPARRGRSSPTRRTCARYPAGGLTRWARAPVERRAEPGRSHALPPTGPSSRTARTRATEVPVRVNVKVLRAAVDVHRDMSGRVPARPDTASAPVPPGGPRRRRWVVIGSIIGAGFIVWIAGFIAYATHDHPGGHRRPGVHRRRRCRLPEGARQPSAARRARRDPGGTRKGRGSWTRVDDGTRGRAGSYPGAGSRPR